jgi:hypothetical protein
MDAALLRTSVRTPRAGLAAMVMLLFVALSILLYRDYQPGTILFSNDCPLGRLMSQCHRLPDRFTGCWEDLNLIGMRNWGAAPSISYGVLFLFKPVWFSKLYAPVGLLVLGLSAWCFFRLSGLGPAACLLGGLAAALNSSFFSAACWGVASHSIAVGMSFCAFAALADTASRWRWLRVVLAGLAVGMSVVEGADVGALFSLYVAAFVIYQAWLAEGPRARNLVVGTGRLALVVVCAVCLAAQAISGLVATEIEGIAGAQQDEQTKQGRWDWATQWSLPKWETLSLAVPGLFGYRMDTPGGGEYWGAVGRAAAWDRYFKSGRQGPPPSKLLRFSGGGCYVGVPVLLLAVWAAVQSLRRKDSVFSLPQRKLVWFWLGIGLISLPLAYGRFAPFYRVFYALPYTSTIRNPVKFLDISCFSLVVLFGYGVDGLWRRYLQPAGASITSRWAGWQVWWGRATQFDKRWALGCAVVVGVSLLAWMIYATSRQSLEEYLRTVQFDEARARAIAGFSIGQVGWFVLSYALAAGLVVLIFSGAFAGARAKWGAGLLGLLLVADLGRANEPWIRYWDYKEKYASNPIIDKLREKPFEHRVAMLPFRAPPDAAWLGQLYQSQWLKHLFTYYNVQCLETVQMPRTPVDLAAFEKALSTTNHADYLPFMLRAWQLTNTRYLMGAAGFYSSMNRPFDPARPPFRILERFDIVSRPGASRFAQAQDLTAVPATNGTYALFEFTQALPRAKLYANWEICTNDETVLKQLAAAAFDPQRTVFVAGGLPPAPPVTGTNDDTGRVEFASYAPKDIVLRSDAAAPSVLLLNDRFDPNWRVRVDGKPERMLRCNYIMRGVYLAPGAHTVEFRFELALWPLYISLAAIGVGLLGFGYIVVAGRGSDARAPAPAASSEAAGSSPRPKATRAREAAEGRDASQSGGPNSISLRRQGSR